MSDSFPRQFARTQRFTLGEPRNVTVSPDGQRVIFLRSSAGDDPANGLWVLDVATGIERQVADPRELLGAADPASGSITDEEAAQRERTRDGSTGITSYATDAECQVASFALNGELYTAGLLSGHARRLVIHGPVFDPRPDPTASRLAYVSGKQLRIGELNGASRILAGDDPKESDAVSWGSADFIAAEEMHRFRGYWWSPDGQHIACCRVDESPVDEWTVADPADPARAPRTLRYPAAGTDNAKVTLHILGLDGSRHEVDWDRDFFPYIARVEWSDDGLLMSVQSRDQRGSMAMKVDFDTYEAMALTSDYDDAWIENVPGVPRLLSGGALLSASDRDGVRRLYVDDVAATPTNLQVRSVIGVADPDHSGVPDIVFLANELDQPEHLHVWTTTAPTEVEAEPGRLTEAPGLHTVTIGGNTVVVRSANLEQPGSTTTVLVDGLLNGPVIESRAETPLVTATPLLSKLGDRDLSVAVLFPHGVEPTDGTKLPVLMDPYGGPHAQRVVASHNAYLSPQWFADQGFAVIIADGRGTPGRGAEWERAVHGDLATAPLDDQVEALHAVAARHPSIDLDRVSIRGWSFGGYLAALAVLKRPDVFHAAIAGAPVTEWRLYDTHYTERYLGDPNSAEGAAAYDASSLLPLANDLTRPLLLIHGLADDNVVAAHTLQLSSALLAAGRTHEVLPLVGVSHMTPQEVIAENLLHHQLSFLSRALGLDLESSAVQHPSSQN